MHNQYVKVENETELIRDSVSKAIINTNVVEYETYVQQRQRMIAEKEAITKNTHDIEELKEEISDMKSILKQILERVS